MELLKINLKVFREGKEAWVHFCYVSPAVKERFDRLVNPLKNLNSYWVSKWAKTQFGFEIDTWEDLEKLKDEIRASYKELYPEIFVDSRADRQGWLRVWYTQNMELELMGVGK